MTLTYVTLTYLNFKLKGQQCYMKMLKVVSATFLLVCFVCLKERTCETRKNVFLFHFKSSFHSRDNQILNFQLFKCHDVIKCLGMKHETHFIEYLGKQTQPGNEIWPGHVLL